MYDDQSKEFKNQFVLKDTVDVDIYKEFVGHDAIEELKELARPLQGKSWVNVNSTCVGGGVAEMLHSIVPFAKGLGINCRWYVIEGLKEFFKVTKKFHNLLQGVDMPITMKEIFHAYLETINKNMKDRKLVGDMVVVHDPQPAAAIMSGSIFGNILWRCHIDTTNANPYVWKFLLPYINQYDGAIFTMSEFIKDGIHIPLYGITPAIDPQKKKNKQLSTEEARSIVRVLLEKHGIDPSRPMVLAVSRYDVHKNQKVIIEAFKKVKQDDAVKVVSPVLVIVGNSASDDPEGKQTYKNILCAIDGDPDIFPLLNIENNDENIGALMKLAVCFVHVSTREGFGLVVTEALWQGTPVIGSRIGGIKLQVIDGETGFLVDPQDVDMIAGYIKTLLLDTQGRELMSAKAIKQVKYNFLLPTLVKKYLLLMRYYLEIDNEPPKFRLNDLTYKEIKGAVYSRKAWHVSLADLKAKINQE